MKKTTILIIFLAFLSGLGLSAQSVAGRYTHASEPNGLDIEVNQIVLWENGPGYTGKWESALATGENEVITQLQNLVVNSTDLTVSFTKDGQAHNGQFISDGKGGYDLVLDGQTMFAKEDW
ncbi:MAG: hypothetical protein H6581_18210 [Bacteroidia bacterium]|nr:hypothetical protein [Bacteroidia bacterium]